MRAIVENRVKVWQAPESDPAGHLCEPRIVRLADGSILVTHRQGVRRESKDGRPRLHRSSDGGRTWEDLGRPFDGFAPAGFDLRGAALTQLAGGDVLTAVIGLDKRLDRPVYNPDGEGLVPLINVVGAFAIGILFGWRARMPHSSRRQRAQLFLGTGVLGGFTTYSALAVESADPGLLWWGAATVLVGTAAAWAGVLLGRGKRAS